MHMTNPIQFPSSPQFQQNVIYYLLTPSARSLLIRHAADELIKQMPRMFVGPADVYFSIGGAHTDQPWWRAFLRSSSDGRSHCHSRILTLPALCADTGQYLALSSLHPHAKIKKKFFLCVYRNRVKKVCDILLSGILLKWLNRYFF